MSHTAECQSHPEPKKGRQAAAFWRLAPVILLFELSTNTFKRFSDEYSVYQDTGDQYSGYVTYTHTFSTSAQVLLGCVLSVLVTPFWTRLSDQRGRTLALLAPILGDLSLYCLRLIQLFILPEAFVRNGNGLSFRVFFWLSQIVFYLFGSRTTFYAIVFAYTADCVEKPSRFTYFSLLLGLSTLSNFLGTIWAKTHSLPMFANVPKLESLGYHLGTLVLVPGIAAAIINIFLVRFWLPESTAPAIRLSVQTEEQPNDMHLKAKLRILTALGFQEMRDVLHDRRVAALCAAAALFAFPYKSLFAALNPLLQVLFLLILVPSIYTYTHTLKPSYLPFTTVRLLGIASGIWLALSSIVTFIMSAAIHGYAILKIAPLLNAVSSATTPAVFFLASYAHDALEKPLERGSFYGLFSIARTIGSALPFVVVNDFGRYPGWSIFEVKVLFVLCFICAIGGTFVLYRAQEPKDMEDAGPTSDASDEND